MTRRGRFANLQSPCRHQPSQLAGIRRLGQGRSSSAQRISPSRRPGSGVGEQDRPEPDPCHEDRGYRRDGPLTGAASPPDPRVPRRRRGRGSRGQRCCPGTRDPPPAVQRTPPDQSNQAPRSPHATKPSARPRTPPPRARTGRPQLARLQEVLAEPGPLQDRSTPAETARHCHCRHCLPAGFPALPSPPRLVQRVEAYRPNKGLVYAYLLVVFLTQLQIFPE